ncbi:hypothetical protein SpCBS45565_g04880 [Spizellomyces sp. 'palustris']|nr:hypothetical protein SpCBS45565_g04880 [Spizellomyces sp. 'palustris']
MSSSDSLKRRHLEDGGNEGREAKKPKGEGNAVFDADKVKAEVAARAREIQEKMAAMRKQGLLPTGSPAPSSPAAPSPPALSRQDEMQRRIDEAKQRIRQSLQANPSLLAAPILPGDKEKRGLNMAYHPALMVDGSGQLNIKGGARALIPKADFATVKANQRIAQPKEPAKKEMKIEQVSADFADPSKNPYYDPKLGTKVVPRPRIRKGFKFVQPGRFVNEANQLRAKAQLEKLKQDIAESVRKTGMDVELDLVAEQGMRKEPPPAVEWWDAPLVPDGYENFDADAVLMSETSIVTNYVQHPIPIQPPAEPGDPKLKPLMLTTKERKKLRRQRRQEAQKEKRDKIRLGLLPPEQNKVKISNLMMVLGTEAVQDPTNVEAAVRAQMAARLKKHKDMNAAGKLTDEQRKEKKRKKLREDTNNLVEVAVFRINDLSHPQHKFKVDMNAQQHNLTGVAILYSGLNVVIVEGGPKGIKAYKKLMTRRIDWSNEKKSEEDGAEEASSTGPKAPNQCVLVWEGEIKDRLFKFFRFKPLPTEVRIKEYLEKMRAVHYWDAAKNYVGPDA